MSAHEETTVVPTELLRTMLDLAVGALDFGSGFWDTEDTTTARRVAGLLGVDPMTVTPSNQKRNFPHPFVPRSAEDRYCAACDELAGHGKHEVAP